MLLIIITFNVPFEVIAQQTAASDSLSALRNTVQFYRQKVKDNSVLFQGRQYIGFDNRIEGHAFFLTSEWLEGDLYYKGRHYQQVPMLYDITAEELVVKHYEGLFRIKLFKEQVDHFVLLGHHFVNPMATDTAIADSKGRLLLNDGFYELLYKGNSQVLAKRKKIVEESIVEKRIHIEFVQNNFFYIEKDGVYYAVKKKGSVLGVLKDRKKEVRQYLTKHKIKFRKNPEFAIVKMVEFYDGETYKQ